MVRLVLAPLRKLRVVRPALTMTEVSCNLQLGHYRLDRFMYVSSRSATRDLLRCISKKARVITLGQSRFLGLRPRNDTNLMDGRWIKRRITRIGKTLASVAFGFVDQLNQRLSRQIPPQVVGKQRVVALPDFRGQESCVRSNKDLRQLP